MAPEASGAPPRWRRRRRRARRIFPSFCAVRRPCPRPLVDSSCRRRRAAAEVARATPRVDRALPPHVLRAPTGCQRRPRPAGRGRARVESALSPQGPTEPPAPPPTPQTSPDLNLGHQPVARRLPRPERPAGRTGGHLRRSQGQLTKLGKSTSRSRSRSKLRFENRLRIDFYYFSHV
jgi:hypothetical protein